MECGVRFPPGPTYWTSSGCVSATTRLQGNGERPGWANHRGVSLLCELETWYVSVAHGSIRPVCETATHLEWTTIDVRGGGNR